MLRALGQYIPQPRRSSSQGSKKGKSDTKYSRNTWDCFDTTSGARKKPAEPTLKNVFGKVTLPHYPGYAGDAETQQGARGLPSHLGGDTFNKAMALEDETMSQASTMSPPSGRARCGSWSSDGTISPTTTPTPSFSDNGRPPVTWTSSENSNTSTPWTSAPQWPAGLTQDELDELSVTQNQEKINRLRNLEKTRALQSEGLTQKQLDEQSVTQAVSAKTAQHGFSYASDINIPEPTIEKPQACRPFRAASFSHSRPTSATEKTGAGEAGADIRRKRSISDGQITSRAGDKPLADPEEHFV